MDPTLDTSHRRIAGALLLRLMIARNRERLDCQSAGQTSIRVPNYQSMVPAPAICFKKPLVFRETRGCFAAIRKCEVTSVCVRNWIMLTAPDR
ncbi:MAG: hypothetical protein CMJ75_11665 [Planctomycetaceae bacterium]|nr:hypothetical protein [Planctomycetaceae bacterium]